MGETVLIVKRLLFGVNFSFQMDVLIDILKRINSNDE